MKTISRIEPLSLGKIYGAVLGVFGFLVGLVVGAFGSRNFGMMGSLGFGSLSIVVFPLLYWLLGFVSGYATAWVYNIVAKKIGGIKVELK